MKKRLLVFVINILLVLSFVTTVFAESKEPVVMIVSVGWQEETLTVTYRLKDGLPKQEITCLVYERLEDGAEGDLLQVAQITASESGIHAFALPVKAVSGGYCVRLGGTGVTAIRSVGFENRYLTSAFGFDPGQTVKDLTAELTGFSDLSVTRGGQILTADELLLPGDQMTGTVNGESVTVWAVRFGDVNLDQQINAADALQMLRHAVGKIELEGAALAAADFVQDGEISAVGALSILKFAVGKITVL